MGWMPVSQESTQQGANPGNAIAGLRGGTGHPYRRSPGALEAVKKSIGAVREDRASCPEEAAGYYAPAAGACW